MSEKIFDGGVELTLGGLENRRGGAKNTLT